MEKFGRRPKILEILPPKCLKKHRFASKKRVFRVSSILKTYFPHLFTQNIIINAFDEAWVRHVYPFSDTLNPTVASTNRYL